MRPDLVSGGETGSVRRGELLALVLAAAAFRLLLLAFLPRVIFGDEAAYLLLGREFWLAGAIPTTHPPLLPFLAGGVWRLTGNPELGTGLWFVFCGAALVFTVVRFAEALSGRKVALLAGALVVVYPALTTGPLYWASMTEPLFTCLIYAGMETAFRGARSERILLVAAAGGLFSLAYLTRPDGGLWMVAALVALVGDRLLRRLPMARAAVHVGVLVFAFVLIALPYLVALRASTGHWTLSGKLVVAWEGGDAVMRRNQQHYDQVLAGLDSEGQPRFSSSSRKGFIELLLANPEQVVGRIAGNSAQLARKIFTQQILLPAFALLAAVAIVARPRSRKRFADDLWLAACVIPVSAFVMFQIEARFFSPAAPALLIWAAAGFAELDRRLAARNRSAQRTAVVAGVGAAVVASLLYGHGPALAERREVVFPSRREAGTWIRRNTPPDALVMAQDDTYGVYSDRPFMTSPRIPYPEWIRYVQAHAPYVVVEEYEVRAFRPYLAFLLDPQQTPPELEAVYRVNDARNQVVVFRVRPASD